MKTLLVRLLGYRFNKTDPGIEKIYAVEHESRYTSILLDLAISQYLFIGT